MDASARYIGLATGLHRPFFTLLTSPTPRKKKLHNHCFQFLLGSTVVPREIEDNSYAKCRDINKMHYGNFGPRETIKISSEVDNIRYSKKTEYYTG